MRVPHFLEVVPGIPVERDAPHEGDGGLVSEELAGPVVHMVLSGAHSWEPGRIAGGVPALYPVLVVVKSKNPDFWMQSLQGWTEMAGDKRRLLPGCVAAGLPWRVVLWLVLHAYGPNLNAMLLVSINPTRKVSGPCISAIFPETW